MRYMILMMAMAALMTGCGYESDQDSDGLVETVTRYNSSDVKTRMERRDRSGKVLEEISYYNSGKIDNRVVYTYNGSGNLSEKYDSSSNDRYTYYYDEQGRMIREVNEDPAGTFESRSYYSEDGRVRIDSSERHEYVSAYHLDELGNTTNWFRLNGLGDTIEWSETLFDEWGNELEYRSWENGRLFIHKKYMYDEKGNAVEERILDADGTIEKKYVSAYDDKNRLISVEQVDDEGQPSFTILYSYKRNEKICKTQIPGMKDKVTKEVFTYYPQDL